MRWRLTACDQFGFSIIPLLIPVNSDAKFLFALRILTKVPIEAQMNETITTWILGKFWSQFRGLFATLWRSLDQSDNIWTTKRLKLRYLTLRCLYYSIWSAVLTQDYKGHAHSLLNELHSFRGVAKYIWLSLQRIGIFVIPIYRYTRKSVILQRGCKSSWGDDTKNVIRLKRHAFNGLRIESKEIPKVRQTNS